jgi:hypothetical protein
MVGRSDGAPILILGTHDIRAAYGQLRERGCGSSVSPTATRGASGCCCWIRTEARSSCNRNWVNRRVSERRLTATSFYGYLWEVSSEED